MDQPDHNAENRPLGQSAPETNASGAQQTPPSSQRQQKRKKTLPIPVAIAMDTAIMGLCLFALCGYLFLIPRPLMAEVASASVPTEGPVEVTATPVAQTTESVALPGAQVEATAQQAAENAVISNPKVEATVPQEVPASARESEPPSAVIIAPEETQEPSGWFADKYAASGTVQTEESYQSTNLNITIQKVQNDKNAYFIADIYVRSLDHLRTDLAQDTFGSGFRQSVSEMAEENEAILAISGDYYGNQSRGVVIRNGTVYRKSINGDVCVLYLDGTLQTYDKRDFSIDEALEKGVYQAWSFGPRLLDCGQPMTEFNTSVGKENPRAAIGYYEPGHYCFVVVDGRQPGYSEGMTMEELSQLFYHLGCTDAYNLDGGQTAQMYFCGEIVNHPSLGGRDVSDIVYIGE